MTLVRQGVRIPVILLLIEVCSHPLLAACVHTSMHMRMYLSIAVFPLCVYASLCMKFECVTATHPQVLVQVRKAIMKPESRAGERSRVYHLQDTT